MGLFSKKENKNEIKKTEDKKIEPIQLEDIFLIPLSEIPEASKMEMALSITKTQKKIEDQGLTIGINYGFQIIFENGERELVDLSSPKRCKGETTVWYRKKDDGVFNKTLRIYEVVTEYRCYFYDLKTHGFRSSDLTPDLEVIVNNQKRLSQSQRESGNMGMGNRGIFTGMSSGTSTSESETIGDVNIMRDGEIDFTFWGVPDPNGLARLIKYEIKRVKESWDKDTKTIDDKTKLENKDIKCIKCNNSNSSKSKFCNKCGHRFTTVCTKCKNVNPSDSSFCNNCGFTLQ